MVLLVHWKVNKAKNDIKNKGNYKLYPINSTHREAYLRMFKGTESVCMRCIPSVQTQVYSVQRILHKNIVTIHLSYLNISHKRAKLFLWTTFILQSEIHSFRCGLGFVCSLELWTCSTWYYGLYHWLILANYRPSISSFQFWLVGVISFLSGIIRIIFWEFFGVKHSWTNGYIDLVLVGHKPWPNIFIYS